MQRLTVTSPQRRPQPVQLPSSAPLSKRDGLASNSNSSWRRKLLVTCAWVLAAVFLLQTSACSKGYEVTDEDRAQIHDALETYLPLLGQAYSGSDTDILEAVAAERERARIDRRVYDLREEGRRLEAEMKTFTIEDIVIWNHANAYVTTFETWDLEVYAVGTEFRMSSAEDQPNRVKYQLKRRGDAWQILHRELQETL